MRLDDIKGEATPTAQTREHILLARQVGVPALLEEEGTSGGLELTLGEDDDVVGLLPADQAAREAARRSS